MAGGAGVKRSREECAKDSTKKSRVAKYGLKFQSAGNLVTVGDRVHMEEGGKRGRGYRDSVEEMIALTSRREKTLSTQTATVSTSNKEGEVVDDSGSKFSFGFSKIKKPQHFCQETEPPENPKEESAPGPPPLMSRQRELMTKAFGGDSDSDGEEGAELVKMAVRGTPRFMFQIRK